MSKGDAQKKLDLANGETFQQKEGGHVEGPSFYQKMKTGDYMIHVFVEETRGLVNPADSESTVDAIVKVDCLGQQRHSQVKKEVGTGSVIWGDHFFFEASITNAQKLENEKIKITVSNHKLFGPDARLGTIEIDFPLVYSQEKHTIFHKWAALANIEKDFEKILGFIKFSVSIVTQGDPAVPLKAEEIGSGFDPNRVLLPPFLNMKMHQMTIVIHRAEWVKKMDKFGKVDPYVKVKFGNVELQTTYKNDNYHPIWQEMILIPVALPSVTETLCLQLYDEDSGKDELIGSCHLKLKQIEAGRYRNIHWMNFYGAPHNSSGKYRDLMNELSDCASNWVGRIQISIDLQPHKNPIAKRENITDQKLLQALNANLTTKWELRSEAYWAMNLPYNNKDYGLQIKWANMAVETKLKNVPKGRMVEWFETLKPIQLDLPHKNPEMLPDVIIWLKYGSDSHFSFARLPASRCLTQDSKPETLYFKIDKAVAPKIRDNSAGVVKTRIWIRKLNEPANLSIGGWDRNIAKKTNAKKWKVLVNLYMAQDLLPTDDTGSSDPICEIYFNGMIFTSPKLDQTLNPIWNYIIPFDAEFDDIEECPPFLCTVWDWDGKDVQADYLGSTVFNVDNSCFNLMSPQAPKWYPLKYGTLDRYFGKVLVSLNVLPANTQILPYNSIEPKREKVYLNMKVLGVRGLKSLGVFDVKKPFIKFDMDSILSLRQRELHRGCRVTATQPRESGPNANILTVLK